MQLVVFLGYNIWGVFIKCFYEIWEITTVRRDSFCIDALLLIPAWLCSTFCSPAVWFSPLIWNHFCSFTSSSSPQSPPLPSCPCPLLLFSANWNLFFSAFYCLFLPALLWPVKLSPLTKWLMTKVNSLFSLRTSHASVWLFWADDKLHCTACWQKRFYACRFFFRLLGSLGVVFKTLSFFQPQIHQSQDIQAARIQMTLGLLLVRF